MDNSEFQSPPPPAPALHVERGGTRPRSSKRVWLVALLALAAAATAGGAWLYAQNDSPRQIGPNTAAPAYIVVNNPTAVTFTSVIADSNLRKHDPKKVLLIRVDASGTPIDIVGRMNDRGRKADGQKNDHTYTVQATLDETTVGPIYFRVAALFRPPLLPRGKDDDDDWDKDLGTLNEPKTKGQRRDRLPPLLRKLQRYTLSDQTTVEVWQHTSSPAIGSFAYPPDWTVVYPQRNDSSVIDVGPGTDGLPGAGVTIRSLPLSPEEFSSTRDPDLISIDAFKKIINGTTWTLWIDMEPATQMRYRTAFARVSSDSLLVVSAIDQAVSVDVFDAVLGSVTP